MSLPYDVVFLDVGYTLVWFYPSVEELALQAWRDAGLSVTGDQLRAAFETVWSTYRQETETVRFPATQEYDRQAAYERERQIMHLLGTQDEEILRRYSVRLAELYRAPGAIRLYDDVVPALTTLKGLGYRLGIVSNWSWNLRDRMAMVGLNHYFDVIMASAYAGCNKPHPDIFRQALERMDVSPGRAVHIGDSYGADVVGARAAGLSAVLLDRHGERDDPDCPVVRDLHGLVDWLAEQ